MDSSSANSLGNISKSSLVSLKAELERKKQEIKKLQTESGTSDGIANCAKYREKPVKKLNINEKANRDVSGRNEKDLQAAGETKEDAAELKHSQDALVAKTKIYEDLMRGKKVLESSNQVLVNFDEKRKDKDEEDVDSLDDDSDSDWTEFTDALGRTRKCLKEDLKHYQNQNKHLEQIKRDTGIVQNKPESEHKGLVDSSDSVSPGLSAELLSFDMKRELMRKQWEEQEQKLEGKSSVHYQDILFGEARQHGVGYYQFSADEKTRAEEIERLNAQRDKTRQARAQAREMRRLKKRQYRTRLLMTENRKRESQGLPPLPLDVDNISSSENEDEKAEEENRKQAALSDMIARKLEEIRKANKTREWDVGKDGQMSQEEWLEKQRAERNQEFAPPTSKEDGGHDKWREIDEKQEERNDGDNWRQTERCGGDSVKRFDKDGKEIDDGKGWSIHGFDPKSRRERNPVSSKDTDSSLSDEQLLKQLEKEEAYSAKSIFCFKKKWADRNKEVFRRYQKPKADTKEAGVETLAVDTKLLSKTQRKPEVQTPIVDTRFIKNSRVSEADIDVSLGGSRDDKSSIDDQEIKLVAKKSKNVISPNKQTHLSTMANTKHMKTLASNNSVIESLDEEQIGPAISSQLFTKKQFEVKTSKLGTNLVQKVNEDDEFIGPPIPKQLKFERESKAETSKTSDLDQHNQCEENEDDEMIGPPIPIRLLPKQIPKDSIEPSLSAKSAPKQLAVESKLLSKPTQLLPTHVTKEPKSPLIPSKLIPRQIAKTPLIPTNLMPRTIISQSNAFLKTGKSLNTDKESAIETAKTISVSSPQENEEKTTGEQNSKAINFDIEEKSDYSDRKSTAPNKNTNETADAYEQNANSIENSASLSEKRTASIEKSTESSASTPPSTEPDSHSNTTFNFLSAKSKTDRLKRKLDRPNVQFDATGRIVNKTNQTDRFRSLSRGAESETSRHEDSRGGSKGAEIAPPTSMEYFTSAKPFSSGGKKRGGGPGAGRGMMEALKVGMEKVEAKKKMRGEKKEKGLLDIM